MAFKHKPHYNVRSRPNKLAAGMTQTAYGCGHVGRMSRDAGRLSVKGTCDTLAQMVPWYIKRTEETCTHCGQRLAKLVLNDRGRWRLSRAHRRQKEKQLRSGLTPGLKN